MLSQNLSHTLFDSLCVGHIHAEAYGRRRSNPLRRGDEGSVFFRSHVGYQGGRPSFEERHRYFAAQAACAARDENNFVVEVHAILRIVRAA